QLYYSKLNKKIKQLQLYIAAVLLSIHHRAFTSDSKCYPLLAPLPPRLDSVCFFKEAKRSSEFFKNRLILFLKFSVRSRELFWRIGLSFTFLMVISFFSFFST